MAKITRQTQTIFAGSASNNGVFGSAQLGTKVLSNDLPTLMGLAAWEAGWTDAVLGTKFFPPLEEFQALDYINTYQLSYLFQEGIPEYDAGTTYFTNSIVKKPGTYQLYGSVTNTNVGNALTNATYWIFLTDLSVSFTTDIFNFAADTGTANHFIIAPNPAVPNMNAGNTIFIKPLHNITGACDVSPNAVATASVKLFDGTDPLTGMMVTTGIYCLVSDGTNWVLLNPSYNFGSAAFLNADNTANNIPVLDSSGRFPALNGSLITNLPAQYTGSTGKLVFGAQTVQWGTTANVVDPVVTFPVAFSGLPTYCTATSKIANVGSFYIPDSDITDSQMQIITGQGSASYFWLAIGPT